MSEGGNWGLYDYDTQIWSATYISGLIWLGDFCMADLQTDAGGVL